MTYAIDQMMRDFGGVANLEPNRIIDQGRDMWLGIRQAIRSAYQLEYAIWEAADFYDGTRHFAVQRKGENLWHKVYSIQLLVAMPSDYLQHEVRSAGEEVLARLISGTSFNDYWD